jgi:hypothetical protein
VTNERNYLDDPRETKRMAYAVLVTHYIQRDPMSTIQKAMSNLDRWLTMNPDAPHYIEWRNILHRSPTREVCALLLEDSERGRHLRSTTPFVGIITEEEREAILGGSSDTARRQ